MLMSTKSGHCHGIARFLSILSCSASLSYTSISAGVIVAVTFEQVDGSPDAKACSKGHHQGLQYSDCAVEKCHIRVRNPNPRNALLCRFSAIQREPKHDLYVVLSFCTQLQTSCRLPNFPIFDFKVDFRFFSICA